MDFCNSRPFLNDDVYRHKKRWGCVAQKPVKGVTPVKVGILFSNINANHFFQEFPIIFF